MLESQVSKKYPSLIELDVEYLVGVNEVRQFSSSCGKVSAMIVDR